MNFLASINFPTPAPAHMGSYFSYCIPVFVLEPSPHVRLSESAPPSESHAPYQHRHGVCAQNVVSNVYYYTDASTPYPVLHVGFHDMPVCLQLDLDVMQSANNPTGFQKRTGRALVTSHAWRCMHRGTVAPTWPGPWELSACPCLIYFSTYMYMLYHCLTTASMYLQVSMFIS